MDIHADGHVLSVVWKSYGPSPMASPPKAFESRRVREDVLALCGRCGVRRLDLFGSAATGHFDDTKSDLDFLVSFEPMAPAAYADAYFSLREGLAELFGRDVDLVTDSSLDNPYFRTRVESERRNLYGA